MFFFVTQFLQVIWGYSALKAGLAYLPFIGTFVVVAGICTRLVGRLGARIPMTIGAVLAPAGMLWLSRVTAHSDYLTGVCLPLILFAAAAGCIFVPLTMTLVAGVSDEHSGVASSMFNAGQQVGGALGLAIIGSVAWMDVYNHITTAVGHLTVRDAMAARPGGALYDHALGSGITTALTVGAGATALALVITVATIRVRKEDLPAGPVIG